MAKQPTKTARSKKQLIPLKIFIEVGRRKNATVEDVELAIKKKLATQPTDIFRNTDTIIIEILHEGGRCWAVD